MKKSEYRIKRDDILVGGLSDSKGNLKICEQGVYDLCGISQKEVLNRLASNNLTKQRDES